MYRVFRWLLISILFVVLTIARVVIAESVTFTYTPLDYPGVSITFPSDINNSGHVVGEYHIQDLQEVHGFLYNGSTYSQFDYPGSQHSIASGINDSGHIVGSYSNDDNETTGNGFIYNGTTYSQIVYPGASLTAASGINNSWLIVGFHSNDGGLTASGFRYDGSAFTPILYPGASRTFAKDINDYGHIVGSYGNSAGTSLHGFLYDGSTFETIDYPGATYSMAFGINNSGHIVGSYTYTGIRYYGFLYDGSTYTTNDLPDVWSSHANGINDSGQIVGDYGTGDEDIAHGFLATPQSTCTINADCDDGQWCNGAETCNGSNECQSGTAPDCNDGNGCTDDSCDEGNDTCINDPIPMNGQNCDDGNVCTENDTCSGGSCNGNQITVPDNYGTIQEAIDNASDGCEIIVRDGTYAENINFNGKAITVKSKNGAASTTIDGSASGSVVTFDSWEGLTSVLDGFSIINGKPTSSYGGGIHCSSSSPSIINCTISGNSASRAGGIYCYSSSPHIINCTISGNSANEGGGFFCKSSSPRISNCTISGNSAYFGSGIFCWDSSPIVVNSILWGNSSGSGGNEIDLYNSNSSITIIYSDIDPSLIEGLGTSTLNSNINADPLFVNALPASSAPTTEGNYHLQSGSPCIDAGTDDQTTYPSLPTDDIDGQPRPQDGNEDGSAEYDIGADEYGTIIQNSITLSSGWNLISFCVEPEDTDITMVLANISGKYSSVWAFKNGNWQVYDPANPGFSDLTTMETGFGYWINMTEFATLTVAGYTQCIPNTLLGGWNLIPCGCIDPILIDPYASDLCDGKYLSIWAFINGAWKVYDPQNPGFSDLTTLECGYGCWVNTTEACTWTLP